MRRPLCLRTLKLRPTARIRRALHVLHADPAGAPQPGGAAPDASGLAARRCAATAPPGGAGTAGSTAPPRCPGTLIRRVHTPATTPAAGCLLEARPRSAAVDSPASCAHLFAAGADQMLGEHALWIPLMSRKGECITLLKKTVGGSACRSKCKHFCRFSGRYFDLQRLMHSCVTEPVPLSRSSPASNSISSALTLMPPPPRRLSSCLGWSASDLASPARRIRLHRRPFAPAPAPAPSAHVCASPQGSDCIHPASQSARNRRSAPRRLLLYRQPHVPLCHGVPSPNAPPRVLLRAGASSPCLSRPRPGLEVRRWAT